MTYPEIERRTRLEPLEFIRRHLLPGRPVVITGGIADWPAIGRWTPARFRELFGDLEVQLQGNGFGVLDTVRLRDYIDALPGHEARGGVVPYLRWSHEGDDFTARAFTRLRDEWSRPAFLPARGYLQPLQWRSDPTRRRYPAFGIYLSPRGAVTQMHADRGRSNALLCQVHGQKRCFMVPPAQGPRLALRRWRPPAIDSAEQAAAYAGLDVQQTTLDPGDVLFIPARWLHEVYTTRTSISLTYNFVHLLEAPRWLPYAVADTLLVQPLEALAAAARRGSATRSAP